jgi:peptidoglycan hydrolase CwlO-like protein
VRCYETLTEDGRRVSKDIIDTFAKGDSDYKEYEENVKLLQNKLTRYKALVEIYSGNVDRLSREWTMRQNEWERGK